MTPVNIQRSATDLATQQPAFVLLRAHAAVTCSDKRQLWQLEGGDLENSAGGPTSKEGRSFIVDLVLEEFAGTLSLPPTHFHLKTHNIRACCMNPTHVLQSANIRSFPHILEELTTNKDTHLSMYVPAEAGGETLYTKSEAALVGQTLHKILRTFIVALILRFSPITACQHHHVTLQTLGVNRMSSNFSDQTAEPGSKSILLS